MFQEVLLVACAGLVRSWGGLINVEHDGILFIYLFTTVLLKKHKICRNVDQSNP